MATLFPGRIHVLVFILVLGFIALFYILTTKKDKLPKVRPIAGLEAIKELVGRAVEMGKPVHFTPGWTSGSLYSLEAIDVIAGMSVLRHLARMVAEYKGRIIVSLSSAELLPMTEEIVRSGFMSAGRPEAYRPEDIRFLSDQQWAYSSGVLGILTREQVASNVMVGPFKAEAVLFAEAAFVAGAIQVAGTASVYQTPFFVACCDYVIIGEEVYAAGAYLSGDIRQLGSIRGADVCKTLVIVIMIVGVILSLLGIPIVSQFLNF